jgi:hypothetical protein
MKIKICKVGVKAPTFLFYTENMYIFANKNRVMKTIDNPQLSKWTRIICNSFFEDSPMVISYTNDFIKKRLSFNRRSSKAFKNKTFKIE